MLEVKILLCMYYVDVFSILSREIIPNTFLGERVWLGDSAYDFVGAFVRMHSNNLFRSYHL